MNFKELQEKFLTHRWLKPVSVTAGFLVFGIVCGMVDRTALSGDYTPADPVIVVQEVYVDPAPVDPATCPDPTPGMDYKTVGNMMFGTPPASPDSPEAPPATATVFSSRFDTLRVEPPLHLPDPAITTLPEIILPEVLPQEEIVPEEEAEEPATTSDGKPRAKKRTVESRKEAAQKAQNAKTTEKTVKTSKAAQTAKTEKISTNSNGGYTKMQTWKKQYPDVMGYLRIPGTNIDYPVVQSSSNLYYESKGYDKNYSKNGVIWADQDVSSSSSNKVLYGHNWTNYSSAPRIGNPGDVMFAQLTAYQYPTFAQQYPTIQYADAGGDGTYVIFGAFYTTDTSFYLNCSLSPVYLAQKAKQYNHYSIDVDVKETDKVVTLSTCTRYLGSFANQRFIVMARKLRAGESSNVVSISS